jgi:thiol-disulfide isomerase/thioredoxin
MTRLQHLAHSRPAAARTTHLVLIVVAVAIVAAVAALVSNRTSEVVPEAEKPRGVGDQFRGLDLQPLTGGSSPISSPDLQNQVVLLSFWGPWCPPCRKELPHLVELQKRFAGRRDFRLVAIGYPPGGQLGDVKSLRDDASDLLKRLDLDLPTYYDADNATLMAMDRLIGFRGFPTTVLLDRQGVIRAIWVGYSPGVETKIEQQIDALLSRPVAEEK